MWGEVSRRGWKPHLVKELVLDKLLEHRGHRVLADCLKGEAKDAVKLAYKEGKAQARGVVHHGKLHLALQAAHVDAIALHPATHGARGVVNVEFGAIGDVGAGAAGVVARVQAAGDGAVVRSHPEVGGASVKDYLEVSAREEEYVALVKRRGKREKGSSRD